jgi:hypothetical protein
LKVIARPRGLSDRLVEGQFVSADGFEIREDDMIAVPDAKKSAVDGLLTLALAWTDGACAPAK